MGPSPLPLAPRRRQTTPHAERIHARSWTHIIWRCWQDRTPYDPTRQGGHQPSPNRRLDIGLLMHIGGLVARRAPHHPARVSHLDDQLVELVLHDPHPPYTPEMHPDRHPVGGTRRLPSPAVPADDRGVRRSRGGWCETRLKPPIPTICAVSAWHRWSDRSDELELAGPRWKMAAARARIAAAISLSAGPLSASGKYSTPPGWPRSSTRSRQRRWR
jgi:hypothetical protein